MIRKVASLALRNYSVSQPRIFSCARSLRFSSLCNRSRIAVVASSPIHRVRQWPRHYFLPLSPLRFLNTFEEQLLRHWRPRVPLSSGDPTMPRKSLLATGRVCPSTMCQYSNAPKATTPLRRYISLNERVTVHLLHTIRDTANAFKPV